MVKTNGNTGTDTLAAMSETEQETLAAFSEDEQSDNLPRRNMRRLRDVCKEWVGLEVSGVLPVPFSDQYCFYIKAPNGESVMIASLYDFISAMQGITNLATSVGDRELRERIMPMSAITNTNPASGVAFSNRVYAAYTADAQKGAE